MLTKNIDTMKAEVAAHIAADAVMQGRYWESGKGCFIGCLTHSDYAAVVTDRFGLPLPMVRIAEHIFESLPANKARAFFVAVPDAIGQDGKDLSRAHWLFLGRVLRRLPPQSGNVAKAIGDVISGMDLLAVGKDWPDADAAACAADAAACAADAAYAAYAAADAAYAAADAAARASYASYAAASARAAASADAAAEVLAQRNDFLNILKDA